MVPILISCIELRREFAAIQKIHLTSREYTLGRELNNTLIIPCLSRYHCKFVKNDRDSWIVEDKSTYGIKVNEKLVGKNKCNSLSDGDIITLDKAGKLIYKFTYSNKYSYDEDTVTATNTNVTASDVDMRISDMEHEIQRGRKRANSNDDACETPSKHKKVHHANISTNNTANTIHNIKTNIGLNIEESQGLPVLMNECEELEDVDISNNSDRDENDIINNLTFEQAMLFINETEYKEQKLSNNNRIKRKKQITSTKSKRTTRRKSKNERKQEIEGIKNELTTLISRFIAEKIEREREHILEDVGAQLTSIEAVKEENLKIMMEIRECKKREKALLEENSMLKEKMQTEEQNFLTKLSIANLSKQDMEEKLKAEIREQKESNKRDHQEALHIIIRETEKVREAKDKEIKEMMEQKMQLEEELRSAAAINDIEKALQMEYEKLQVEKLVNERMAALSDENINKINILQEALRRESEKAVQAAASLQQYQEQSQEEINALRQQIRQMKNQVQSLETEKHTLLEEQFEIVCSSRQSVLSDLGHVMESELQCSICVEMFVSPVILNCSHTFCKFCLTVHKTRNMDCPLCRAHIVSQCNNLVLNTLVEKMVASLNEEMREKRREILESRAAEVVAWDTENARQTSTIRVFEEDGRRPRQAQPDMDRFQQSNQRQHPQHVIMISGAFNNLNNQLFDQGIDMN